MKNAYSETATANRYDAARSLPPQTKTLWLEAFVSSVPRHEIKKILDLGCGTGRFTAALAEAFESSVVGVEPSEAMLNLARSQPAANQHLNIAWVEGAADNIPLKDETVDLVFMSQVFHHLTQPQRAFEEIHRVLSRSGYLAIRNGVREENGKLVWLEFFPEAREIEEKRTPSRKELKTAIGRHLFNLISERTIQQLFAATHDEYFNKISRRGLSALIAISDESFQLGLQRLRHWVSLQPAGVPVYEPVDLFIFQKRTISDDEFVP